MKRWKNALKVGTFVLTICVAFVTGCFVGALEFANNTEVVENDVDVVKSVAMSNRIEDSETVEEFYVTDNVRMFSSEEVYSMRKQAEKLAGKKDGIQIVVLTMKSCEELENNGQASVEKAVNDLYKSYDIGKNDNGILITYFDKENKIIINCGNDNLGYNCSSILSGLEDYLYVGNVKEVIVQLQSSLVERLIGPLTYEDLIDYYSFLAVAKDKGANTEVICENAFTGEEYYYYNNME